MSAPRPDRLAGLAVAAGGAAGALLRLGIAEAVPVGPEGWPWATLAANLAGAALLAATVGLVRGHDRPRRTVRALVGAGFCGALTTFSTLQLEAVDLWRDGGPLHAAAYYGLTVTASLGLVAAVSVWADRVHARRAGRT